MGRRRYTVDFKRKVVVEAMRGDATVREIAARHGINPNQRHQEFQTHAISVLRAAGAESHAAEATVLRARGDSSGPGPTATTRRRMQPPGWPTMNWRFSPATSPPGAR